MIQILQDAEARPELFYWFGAPEREKFYSWCLDRKLLQFNALVSLLETTGGGDMFESETILAPFLNNEIIDNADTFNAIHKQKGLSSEYWLFHIGFVLSAIKYKDGFYAVFSKDYQLKGVYKSLNHWYVNVIRAEYKDRYHLFSIKK